jgi:hypothetical protein
MTRQMRSLSDISQLEQGRGLVKTYVLEADRRFRDDDEYVSERLDHELSDFAVIDRVDTQLRRIIPLPSKGGRAQGQSLSRPTYFLDTEHPRLWYLSSDGPSDQTDRFWSRLVRVTGWLDKTWLPAGVFDVLSSANFGDPTGVTSRFVQRFDEPPNEFQRDWLSIKLWGSRSPQALRVLRNSVELRDSITLTALRLRYGDGFEDPAHDDITYDGKVTSWGAFGDAHQDLLRRVFEEIYLGRLIQPIEQRFRLDVSPDEGVVGGPLLVRLHSPVDDASAFARQLLSGKGTVRLSGFLDISTQRFARIIGVDQHVGQSVTLDVRQDSISITLKPDGCGNSVVRLWTLVQQELDPQAQLTDREGNVLFP